MILSLFFLQIGNFFSYVLFSLSRNKNKYFFYFLFLLFLKLDLLDLEQEFLLLLFFNNFVFATRVRMRNIVDCLLTNYSFEFFLKFGGFKDIFVILVSFISSVSSFVYFWQKSICLILLTRMC